MIPIAWAIRRRSPVLAYRLSTVVSHKTCPRSIRNSEGGWELCARLKQAFPRLRYSCIILSESAKRSWSLVRSTHNSYVTPLKVIGLAYFAHHETVLCMSRDYTESSSVTWIHKTSTKYHYRCLGRTPNSYLSTGRMEDFDAELSPIAVTLWPSIPGEEVVWSHRVTTVAVFSD